MPRYVLSNWRMATLIALGSWIVHQVRATVMLGDTSTAHALAHAQQHAELVGPMLVWINAIAAASWALSLRRDQAVTTRRVSFRGTWIRTSLVLLFIFFTQETLEGLLAPGHPPILAGTIGGGGWIVIPLALAVGALIALAVRGGRAIRVAIVRARQRKSRRAVAQSDFEPPQPGLGRRLHSRLIAANLAGRAPPLLA